MYQKYLDPVIDTFTTGEFYQELFKAKKEYFELTGAVSEEDAEFENHMCTFMDWYLFSRPLPSTHLTPIRSYLKRHTESFSEEERKIYEDFCNTIHSIFSLRKIKNGKIYVKDLFSKKNYEVNEPEIKIGFMKRDLFETRLIPFFSSYEFSKGFCFHPIEMERFILGEIKKIRDLDSARHVKLILQLAAMKLKQSRYQHINIKHIYTFAPKF